jgi:primosomal protein N' (replication factor Y)
MSGLATFVDVIIPVAIPNLLTYRVPRDLEEVIKPGVRVIVQLGKSKLHTAIVRKVHGQPPRDYTAKSIEYLLDEEPIVLEHQMRFWEWMADYYLCTTGEVLGAALPSTMKLASETKIVLSEREGADESSLSDREFLVLEALEIQKKLQISEIAEILGIKTVQPIIKGLIDKGFATTEEELKHRYKPKTEEVLCLSEDYHDDDLLGALCNELEKRAPKQMDLLLAYLRENPDHNEGVAKVPLQKKAEVTASVSKSLIEKGVFRLKRRDVNRLPDYEGGTIDSLKLSSAQQQAFEEVKTHFEEKDIVLLHGVTGSGKTEIYVKLIEEALERNEQVLYLLPEIALTTQLIERLRKYFGDEVGVYHSKFNQQERAEVWLRMLKTDAYKIVIGARSSLFLPFNNLGLVIVDEEHETSFKQHHPAPRYNGRDAAIVLALQAKAKVLLGSATPAIESYYNAEQGRYGLVELTERYGGVIMPEILCADIRKELQRKTMRSHFTGFLIEQIEDALKRGKQVILFQNRRGYAPLWRCATCGWVPECERCDVSLTYHKRAHHLNCHYCGYTTNPPVTCKACGSSNLTDVGFGTEKIEEDLNELFPKAKVARMDLDTTRSKHAYVDLLTAFDDGDIDILVGTQMVTKGLDFENVALVGVLNADQMLKFPDFRAFERAYQLMTQVSGRAGRKSERGKVVIQTYDPEHWVIRQVINGDYDKLYKHETIERKGYVYPPYVRLIRLNLRHKDKGFARKSAVTLANMLKAELGNRVVGPEAPYIERVNNYYHQNILLKVERSASVSKFKSIVRDNIQRFHAEKENRSVRIVPDVDPI